MTTLFVLTTILVVVGILATGVYKLYDWWWFSVNGVQVQGQIIDVDVRRRTSTNSDTGLTTTRRRYIAAVRFTTAEGQLIETRTPATGRRRVDPGNEVFVKYDPQNPTRARIQF